MPIVDNNIVYVGQASTNITTEDPLSSRLFFEDQKLIHIVNCESDRQEDRLISRLEECLYRPGTPANRKFFIRCFLWFGSAWSISSVPSKDLHRVEAFMLENRRILTKEKVSPLIVPGNSEFPFWGRNFWRVRHQDGMLLIIKHADAEQC